MPVQRTYDEDLFKDSTMTFGEHLDELRKCLFRAVLSLAIGFGIGLLASYYVVDLIKSPLENALKEYYGDRTIERFKQTLAEMQSQGQAVPPELADDEAIRKLIFDDGLLFEERFVNVRQLVDELQRQFPEEWGSVQLPAAGADERPVMTRLFLWHKASDDERLRIRTLNAPEPFMIYIKAAFLTGAVLSAPFVFYFLWSFVAAGLYPHEKRYVHVFLPFSLLLFVLGVLVAFLFVFPPVLRFFFSFNHAFNVDPDPRLSEWLGFVLMLPVAFGISFQLPLVMLFLERIGIFTASAYTSKWRIAVLSISIISMVLSPGGDPYSMMLMMIPLVFLYFGGIGLCKWMPRMA